jgi:fructokinase
VDGGLNEYEFVVDGTSALNLTMAMVPEKLPPGISALHVGSLGLAFEPMASTLTSLIKREGRRLPIMLDPNIRLAAASDPAYRARLEAVVQHASIVKGSVEDLTWLFPGIDYKAAARHMLEMGVRLVVVTLGVNGAFGATEHVSVSVAAPEVDVVDTIGAGDTFGAALLARLYDLDVVKLGLKLDLTQVESALRFACLAAAITCTRAGADSPYRAELQQSLDTFM